MSAQALRIVFREGHLAFDWKFVSDLVSATLEGDWMATQFLIDSLTIKRETQASNRRLMVDVLWELCIAAARGSNTAYLAVTRSGLDTTDTNILKQCRGIIKRISHENSSVRLAAVWDIADRIVATSYPSPGEKQKVEDSEPPKPRIMAFLVELSRHFEDECWEVRAAAIEATFRADTYRLSDSTVLDRLVSGLEDDHWLVRHNASRALKKYFNHLGSARQEKIDKALMPGCFLGWGFTCFAPGDPDNHQWEPTNEIDAPPRNEWEPEDPEDRRFREWEDQRRLDFGFHCSSALYPPLR